MRPAAPSLFLAAVVFAGFPWCGRAWSAGVEERLELRENAEAWLGRDADLLLEIAHAVEIGRRGDEKGARALLAKIAEAAWEREHRQAWLRAQRWGLRFSVKELTKAEIASAVTELLARAREWRMWPEETEIFNLWAETLETAGDWTAAARAYDRAGQRALENGAVARGVEALLEMARVYREAGQPERRAQVWTRLQQVLAERGKGLPRRVLREVERERGRAPLPANAAKPDAGVDLQPSLTHVQVSAEDRELGRARLVLTNASPFPVTGVLRVVPGHSRVGRWESGELGVFIPLAEAAEDREADGETARELTLSPGRQLFIYLERGPDGPDEETVTLSWEEAGAPPVLARVSFFFVEGLPRVSVTNAGVYRLRAGWNTPLYHEIYGRSRIARVENLQVKASAPSRLEILDQSTGRPLAVDAEGDGEFNSPDDRVFQDHDGDGNPDLIVGDRAQAIEIQVWPGPSAAGEEITVTAGLRDPSQEGGWRTDAVNTIRP